MVWITFLIINNPLLGLHTNPKIQNFDSVQRHVPELPPSISFAKPYIPKESDPYPSFHLLQLFELSSDDIIGDSSFSAGLSLYPTGGRALLSLPLVSESAMDIFAGNEVWFLPTLCLERGDERDWENIIFFFPSACNFSSSLRNVWQQKYIFWVSVSPKNTV